MTRSDTRAGGYATSGGYRFELSGGALCLDFANTLDSRPTDAPRELLPDYLHLVDWGEQAGALTPTAAQALRRGAACAAGRAGDVLHRARALREAVFRVFACDAQGAPIPRTAWQTVRRELRASLRRLQLLADRGAFRLDWDGPPALDRVLWPVARSVAQLLTSAARGQVRVCAADDCDWLFLDASKNRSRRWCDMRVCGNRSKVRRFRAARR